MTSILVHSAGGAGANRAIDSERVPIELQRVEPRGPNGQSGGLAAGGVLLAHEKAGGHLLSKHVGLRFAELEARLFAEPGPDAVSTFVNRAEAEAAISSVMAQRSADIQAWVAKGAHGTRPFEGDFTGGEVLLRGEQNTTEGRRVRVVLRGNGHGDFFILTGFPRP